LGTLREGADINQTGQVVGVAGAHAVLWDNDAMIDLGTLGGNWSVAHRINDLGQVVGRGTLPGEQITHAFLVNPQGGVWFRDSDLDGRNDFMIDLGTLNGATYYEPLGINNAGQVVGTAFGDGGGHAFLWDMVNGMTGLPAPAGTYTYAAGINESGQVAGQVWYYDPLSGEGPFSAFLWDATSGMTLLGAGPGYTDSGATGINDNGQVIGGRWNAGEQIGPASLWTPDAPNGHSGSFIDLGMLPGADVSRPLAINNVGHVVGSSMNLAYDESGGEYDYNPRAFLWDATDGMVELQHQLLPGSDATLQYAVAINNGGAIVVNGDNSSGEDRAYLLTPIPPSTPTISIEDAQAVTEGNTGTTQVTFTVTLSEVSDQTVTVDFTTAAGSATAGSDYLSASGTLTFASGELSKTVTVLVNGDRFPEPNETFAVNLSNPTNATIADSQGQGTITDDEPRISISDVSKKEGKRGQTTLFVFAVTLSAAYDQAVTMSYATANGTAKTSDSDYVAKSGTLTFAPGETTKTITIEVIGDKKWELAETFYVDLFGLSTNALFTDDRGLGTILNDD
jgi:probable HAF family extracellular repeat protein